MKPSICLNMIVRNEAPVIRRCLETIKPWIDTWLISDTGSDDGTQEIIQDCMKDIPGQLVEVPWVDFAYNRNKALDLAREMGDYSLFMDADQQFIPVDGFKGIYPHKDCYSVKVKEPSLFGSISTCYFLLNNQTPIKWEGVLHEYLSGPSGPIGINGAIFSGGHIFSITQDGNRSKDPKKYLKDAKVLEKVLEKEPNNPRYTYYLGQSYLNGNDYEAALNAFEKRSQMGGSDIGECFFATFMVGSLQEKLGYDQDTCLESYLRAHEHTPSRQEPIYKIGQIYLIQRKLAQAYDLLKPYAFVYNLEDQYCIQADIRDYLLPILFAHVCYDFKKYEECYYILNKVNNLTTLPHHLKTQLKQDLSYLREQIPYLGL